MYKEKFTPIALPRSVLESPGQVTFKLFADCTVPIKTVAWASIYSFGPNGHILSHGEWGDGIVNHLVNLS